MVATTRYREYYDSKFTANQDNITIKSERSKLIHILNTVAPPVPEVVYVLPIFIWEDAIPVSSEAARNGETITRKVRRGLRVYMRRNWCASGDDERLAVVFAPKGASDARALEADPDNQVPVTQWGTNPIWYTTPAKRQPTVDDASVESDMRFEGIEIAKHSLSAALAAQRDVAAAAGVDATGKAEDISVDSFRKADEQVVLSSEEVVKIDVAAFRVNCDLDKDFVYADVEFKDTESYSKMVKLALARFQQYSAPYAYLSPVSSWVFQPIGPDRTISFGVVSEINEDPLRPSRQIRFAIGGNSPGNLAEGYRKNSLEASLFDGETLSQSFRNP